MTWVQMGYIFKKRGTVKCTPFFIVSLSINGAFVKAWSYKASTPLADHPLSQVTKNLKALKEKYKKG